MTLTKAIEAAREAMISSKKLFPKGEFFENASRIHRMIDECLAALPEKPMTEDEIRKIIDIELANKTPSIVSLIIFRALKAANVLYVAEEK